MLCRALFPALFALSFAPRAEALELTQSGIAVAGATATMAVTGGTPGTNVHFFFSRNGEGRGACAGGVCLGVRPGYGRAMFAANPAGRVGMQVSLPVTLAGVRVCVQAASSIGGQMQTSNVLCFYVLPPTEVTATWQESGYWLPGVIGTYDEALAACDTYGLVPAVANDLQEEAFLRAMSPTGDVWLGLTDVAVEGTFLDAYGATPLWFDWAIGEPNGLSAENCVITHAAGGWVDVGCQELHDVVCEVF